MNRIKISNLRAVAFLCVLLLLFTSCHSFENTQETIPIIDTVDFEYKDLSISAKQVSRDDTKGIGIELLIENQSTFEYVVYSSAVIINNGMTDLTYAFVIEGKERSIDQLYIPFEAIESAGIIEVGHIEIYFDVQNLTTNESITNAGVLTVKMSEPSLPMVSGHILYDQHGIKIYGQYVDETTVWGSSVLLYVQNTSDKNIIVYCEQVSFNDCEVASDYNELIYANKHSVDNIPLASTNMNVNEINSSDSIVLKLKIIDSDTMNVIDETPPIGFYAN